MLVRLLLIVLFTLSAYGQIQRGTFLPSQCSKGDLFVLAIPGQDAALKVCKNGNNEWADSGGSTAPVAKPTLTFPMNIPNPTTSDSGFPGFEIHEAATAVRVSCSTSAGSTVSINFNKRSFATPNTPGTNMLPSDLPCDDNSQATMTFSSPAIAADSPIKLIISSVSGSPIFVSVSFQYANN